MVPEAANPESQITSASLCPHFKVLSIRITASGRQRLSYRCSFHLEHLWKVLSWLSLSRAPSVEDIEAKDWSGRVFGLSERGLASYMTSSLLSFVAGRLPGCQDSTCHWPALVSWAFSCPLTDSFVAWESESSMVLRVSSHAFTFPPTQFFSLVHF